MNVCNCHYDAQMVEDDFANPSDPCFIKIDDKFIDEFPKLVKDSESVHGDMLKRYFGLQWKNDKTGGWHTPDGKPIMTVYEAVPVFSRQSQGNSEHDKLKAAVENLQTADTIIRLRMRVQELEAAVHCALGDMQKNSHIAVNDTCYAALRQVCPNWSPPVYRGPQRRQGIINF